ncbi:MAG: Choice-of-anchor protein, partial [Thermodesulfobacteriota bacterium]|nr:Choice-of-anchor protein [Thermodesulfobacteriota bacterium]
SARPVSYTFTSAGTKTLYAWAKDAAGNVSGSRSMTVIITISGSSGVVADISTPTSLDFGSIKIKESVEKTIIVTNKGTATLMVAKVEVVGADASAFKVETSRFKVNPSKVYKLEVNFKPTAQRSFTATLKIYSNDPDTTVKEISLRGKGVL